MPAWLTQLQMADSPIKPGKEYDPEYLFRTVRDRIHSVHAGIDPYLALFGCSDEVNGSADSTRAGVFGGYGGIFTTRIIGSQIFYQQIKVATSRGHRSNVFEVNVHIGEIEKDGRRTYGMLIGRDGQKRATCGALAHVLEDFQKRPDDELSISMTDGEEKHLDFLAMLKFRLKPHVAGILSAPDPIQEITRKNLDVQIKDLVRHLQNMIAADKTLAPLFVFGTISYNRTTQPDTNSLNHFYILERENPKGARSLI